ncbi:MAG: hypothetical protein A2722_03495 [Candidatus Doudnabacteria bacterium RIFCSPHIGHO2_01_FULL_50_11]|uniref:acylphosphatase n=1 Tax=Candidatus Doudnabacteria bacterium RIFCSPHIGHO2_01_FULL_50_11 TaxID=1817828 RepID=A0A1F5PIP3_9BACT|nr:MAG: hypothetical protein A2722_03495 [Candidatus Doudnabacteria bacterium RIFCSPHIGHO2_01_FULL_50_11]HLC44389.1 acylphosphatase [Patescibacteria group bacterium]
MERVEQEHVRLRVHLTGAVQGVGLRYFSKREAEKRSLAGFVRNERDGSVTIEVEGAQKLVDGFVKWLESEFLQGAIDGLRREGVHLEGGKFFVIKH